MSSRRPHRQVRKLRGRGKWRRRQSKRRNGCASNLVTLDVGRAVNGVTAKGPLLGSEEGPRWTIEQRPNLSVNETLFHHTRHLLLPPIFRLTGFGVLHPRWCLCQFPPRRNLKACILTQSATSLDTLETSDGALFQLCDHCLRDVRVPVVHHAQTIGPASPMGTFPILGRCSTPVLPPRNSNWQDAYDVHTSLTFSRLSSNFFLWLSINF